MGLYWDNGKDNGNYYSILGLYSWVRDITPIMENQTEKNTEHEMEARVAQGLYGKFPSAIWSPHDCPHFGNRCCERAGAYGLFCHVSACC